jgi:oligoribonuclease NrnB/cAMP/cGMP phosphodiesterase (DHH superfamily)
MNPRDVSYVVYHGNCFDGFGAAYAASTDGCRRQYLPWVHGGPEPRIPARVNVLFVDIVPTREFAQRLIDKGCSVGVLDHHRSAEAFLEGEGQELFNPCVFSLVKSGAILSWEYFRPGQPIPALLRYVEDRDLWRWTMDRSREYNAAVRAHARTFEVWDGLTKLTEEHLTRIGSCVLGAEAQMMADLLQQALTITLDGELVPVINSPVLMAELCDKLLEARPDAKVVGYYFDRGDGVRQFGLRSRRGGPDVSVLAAKYGGGGHRNAAGFQKPLGWLGDRSEQVVER